MLKAAKDHNTNLATVKTPARLRKQLPAWYHIDEELSTLKSRPEKCLIERHKTSTVTDLINVSARVRNQNGRNEHTPNPFCICQDCCNDQEKGCYNPHVCAQTAQAKLQCLSAKWNPWGPENPQDGLSLTPTCKNNNMHARISNEEIIFNPTLTCGEDIAEAFCVFIDPNKILALPALCLPPNGRNPTCPKITIFTDGACLNNGKRNATCRGGVWVSHGSHLNAAI